MAPNPRTPHGSARDRYIVVLVGVLVGYVVGHWLEGRFGWPNAGILTMPVGGLLAGVIARFTLARFQEPPDKGSLRRLR